MEKITKINKAELREIEAKSHFEDKFKLDIRNIYPSSLVLT